MEKPLEVESERPFGAVDTNPTEQIGFYGANVWLARGIAMTCAEALTEIVELPGLLARPARLRGTGMHGGGFAYVSPSNTAQAQPIGGFYRWPATESVCAPTLSPESVLEPWEVVTLDEITKERINESL